jgi:hypothetical protein
MINSQKLDAGAKALREFEMAGKITRDWADIPKAQKRKWWAKAQIVLDAADRIASPKCPGGIDPGFGECPKCGATMDESCAGGLQ